ncbi:MAG TPA: hypothetical protein VGE72_22985 [Azospirillum sp.]
MPAKVTAIIRAEELPKSVAAQFPKYPIPGTRYRVIAEPVDETDEEKLAWLRAAVAEGMAEADAGRLLDEDEVFSMLQAKFPDPDA